MISVDDKDLGLLNKALARKAPGATFQAYKRSITRTLSKTSLLAYRLFAEEFNGKISELKKSGAIYGKQNNGDGKSINSMSASLNFSTKRLSLSAFNARAVRKGVKYGRGKFIAGGFRAPTGLNRDELKESYSFFIRNGNFVVPSKGTYKGFVVKRGANKGKLMVREQLTKLKTVSASLYIDRNRRAQAEVESNISFEFDKEFASNLDYYLDRALARAQQ